jgi:3-deoxy-D-manno-octulosonate 8-phosphate phosphatase (KDO 8-P phosphatase)
MSDNILSRLGHIRFVALDVDGVLTDGKLFILPEGQALRGFNIKDGYAIQLAVRMGLEIAIVSGSGDEAVYSRFSKLGVRHIFLGVKDKKSTLNSLLDSISMQKSDVLFMGDDLPDLAVMQSVGLAACPADAASEIKKIAHYVSPLNGGNGCVRDVLEKILKLQDKWDTDTDLVSR